MKRTLFLPVLAACTVLAVAEPPTEGTGPKPTPPAFSGPGNQPGDALREKMRKKVKENFPPEIRERFDAAREKALQDPKIQELKKKADAANGEFLQAMREAIMKADPGLAEMVKERFGDKMKEGRDGKPGEVPAFANLSEGDRQKLMAAREKTKSDPAVQAAEAKKAAAKTPEERRTATEEFHKVMKEALLKADPTLGPILEQMKPPMPPQRPPGPPTEDGKSGMETGA